MMKFLKETEEVLTYEEPLNEVESDLSPFKEILNKEDYTSFNLKLNEESETIALGEVFQLQVNVKKVGSFHFILNKETFNKKETIKKISELKNMEITDENSAKDKITALLEAIKECTIHFIVFKSDKDSSLSKEGLIEVVKETAPLFLIKEKEEVEEPKEQKEEGPIKHPRLHKVLMEMKNNKFHLLLLLISTLLFGISIPLAILNMYANNYLWIFLLVCALIGVGMNGYTYYDFYKKHGFKDLLFVLSVIVNVIALGLSSAAFTLFYSISTKPENCLPLSSLVLIGLGISAVLSVLGIFVPYFLSKVIKRKDEEPKEEPVTEQEEPQIEELPVEQEVPQVEEDKESGD